MTLCVPCAQALAADERELAAAAADPTLNEHPGAAASALSDTRRGRTRGTASTALQSAPSSSRARALRAAPLEGGQCGLARSPTPQQTLLAELHRMLSELVRASAHRCANVRTTCTAWVCARASRAAVSRRAGCAATTGRAWTPRSWRTCTPGAPRRSRLGGTPRRRWPRGRPTGSGRRAWSRLRSRASRRRCGARRAPAARMLAGGQRPGGALI